MKLRRLTENQSQSSVRPPLSSDMLQRQAHQNWNRHELAPTDADYPKVNSNSTAKIPSYIVDLSSMPPSVLEAKLASRAIKPLQPYTLIMVLDGHGAAVNAIQIDGDLIVSASGDRFIKLWRLADGSILKTLVGHQKGIACVQSDGRRIVSGSSDNSVRIYDHATGAEVAMLCHTNLVRTIQAGFGDFPGAAGDLTSQARAAEDEYVEGVRTGAIVEDKNQTFGRPKNGVDNVNQIRSFGAKVPPGGEVVIGAESSPAPMMRPSLYGRRMQMGAGLWDTACDKKLPYVPVRLLICAPITKAGLMLVVHLPLH